METNGAAPINELAAALAKAQGEIGNAARDRENPHFRSKYATLASVREAIQEPFAKHGLAVAQTTKIDGEWLVLVTKLMHSSGQCLVGEYPVCSITEKPQVAGSAMTYARRFSLSAITGVAPGDDDDDDGAAAQQSSRPARKAPPSDNPRIEAGKRLLALEAQIKDAEPGFRLFDNSDGHMKIVDPATCEALQRDPGALVSSLSLAVMGDAEKHLAGVLDALTRQ